MQKACQTQPSLADADGAETREHEIWPVDARFATLLAVLIAVVAPAMRAQEAITVGGSVLDASEQPLAGARIHVFPILPLYQELRWQLEGHALASATTARTDRQGHFQVEVRSSGMWRLLVAADGFVPQEVEIVPLLENVELSPVILESARATEVTIVDERGAALPGAHVCVTAPSQSQAPSGRRSGDGGRTMPGLRCRGSKVDRFGRIVLVLPPAAKISATASGFLPAEMEADDHAAAARSVRLALKAASRRSILVLDPDQTPIEGALILVGSSPVTLTDTAGRAEIPVPEGGSGWVSVLTHNSEIALHKIPLEQDTVTLSLPSPGRVSGKVTSDVGGPLGGAWVWLRFPGRATKTLPDGSFHLTDYLLEPDREARFLHTVAVGYLPSQVALDNRARDQHIDVALPTAGRIRGRVVNELGGPIPAARIEARRPRGRPKAGSMTSPASRQQKQLLATSGPDGAFELAAVPLEQALEVLVHKEGFSSTAISTQIGRADRETELTVRLVRGRLAWGTVLDEHDSPIAHARVFLDGLRLVGATGGQSPWEELDRSAETDEEGHFYFSDVASGRYDLRVEAARYAPLTVPGVRILEEDRNVEIGTVVLVPGASLEGVVTDVEGAPIAGAVITVDDSSRSLTVKSQDDGVFVLMGLRPAQPFSIDVRRVGFIAVSLDGLTAPGERVEINLERSSVLRGRIVDSQGDSLAGVLVLARPTARDRETTPRGQLAQSLRVTSTHDGLFEMHDVSAGEWNLSATKAGYQAATQLAVEVSEDQPPEEILLVLKDGAALAGRIIDSTGSAVVGAKVARAGFIADGSVGQIAAMWKDRTTSSEDGAYRLEGLSPGSLSFEVSHPDFPELARVVEITEGENEYDFILEAGLEISGRVTDPTGRPLAGAEVQARSLTGRGLSWSRGTATTEEEGKFTLGELGSGSYELRASRKGYAKTPSPQTIRLEGASVHGVELVLDAGTTVVGSIQGLTLEEMAATDVIVDNLLLSFREGKSKPDYDGKFQFEDLGPAEWRVTASMKGTGKSAHTDFRIEPGDREVSVEIRFDGAFRLSGMVLRDGESVAGVRVRASGRTLHRRSFGNTDQSGRFVFDGLPSDTYLVQVRRVQGDAHEELVVLDGDRDLVIELFMAHLSGTVVDAATGEPISNAEVSLHPADGWRKPSFFSAGGVHQITDSAGRFHLSQTPKGLHRLEASRQGYSIGSRLVEVSDSTKTSDIEIPLRQSVEMELALVGPTGTPVRAPVTIAALDREGQTIFVRQYLPGEDGRVRTDEIPPGGWDLLIDSAFLGTIEVAVEVPGDSRTVVFPGIGVLNVYVPELAAKPMQAHTVILDGRGRKLRTLGLGRVAAEYPLVEGKLTLPRISVGPRTVQVRAADGRTWTATTVVYPRAVANVVLE